MISLIYLAAVYMIPFISNEKVYTESNSSVGLPPLENDGIYANNVSISPSNSTFVIDKIIPLQESDEDIPNQGKHSKLTLKPVVYEFLQKVSPTAIMQGLHDKLKDIKLYWTHPNRPNFGGVQFASPEQIWEKLHEKGHHFLTGINGAIFGLAGAENHDYPFPYRSLNTRSDDN